MKATAWEYRFRLWIGVAIVTLGFWAPWSRFPGWDPRATQIWGWLALELARAGISSTTGFTLITALAIAAAALGWALRFWATASLGPRAVYGEMKANPEGAYRQAFAGGPFRRLRNPLYLGSYLTVTALAILMPPSGAAIALPLLAIFLLRLILAEEESLSTRLGPAYREYKQAVPRLIPSFRPRVEADGQSPQWPRALLGELFPLGVFLSFATLSWRYNPQLLIQAALVSFGLSLVFRAL